MRLTITGRIPSKKNSVMISCRGKFPLKRPSKQYEDWHKEASYQLYGKIPKEPIARAAITIAIFSPDRRMADLTNKAESVMDLLVDNKILADDNWYVCDEVRLEFLGLDKKNPRAEVLIEEKTGARTDLMSPKKKK